MIVTVVEACAGPLVPVIVTTYAPLGVNGGLENPPLHPAISSAAAARPVHAAATRAFRGKPRRSSIIPHIAHKLLASASPGHAGM